VFVATHDPNSICISEDVHYYENDLQKEIERAIQDGNSMYIDDLDWHPFMHAVEACYDSMYDDIRKEVENELIEQGYEYEDADEAIA
jgi:glutamyl/glutaminyl-tRNA synthetase